MAHLHQRNIDRDEENDLLRLDQAESFVEIDGNEHAFIHFVADESHLTIEGKEHLLVGCLGFAEPLETAANVVDAKFEVGLELGYEIKWGKRDLSEEVRQAFTERIFDIVSGAKCAFAILHEGRDKQHACEALVRRIVSYCNANAIGVFTIVFDRNLVRDAKPIWKICSSADLLCLGVQEHESAYDQVIQLADLFTGFFSYSIRQTLNEGQTGEIEVQIDGDDEIEAFSFRLPVNRWFFVTAMSLLDQTTTEYADGEDTWVERDAWGSGFLIRSSISSSARSRLREQLVSQDYFS